MKKKQQTSLAKGSTPVMTIPNAPAAMNSTVSDKNPKLGDGHINYKPAGPNTTKGGDFSQ